MGRSILGLQAACKLLTLLALQPSYPPVVAASEDDINELHFLTHHETDYPYDEVISSATAFCYQQLANNTDCCLDQHLAPHVKRLEFRRPGTEWFCDSHACYDSTVGPRGYDAVWVPDGATCESPRVLYIHGGSWMYGSPDTMGYGQLATKLAAKSGAVVMVPDYPLIPYGNFSTMMKAAKSALQWLALQGPWQGCTAHPPILVGGDSAGGGTALSLILQVKSHPEEFRLIPDDRTGRVVAGGFFFSPWTNLVCDTPDYYHNAFAKIVDEHIFQEHKHKHRKEAEGDIYTGDIIFHGHPDANEGGFQLNSQDYVGDYHLLKDPIASPIYAGARELAGGGVPPLYFAVGSSESILGDSVIVAQKAAAFGAEVSLEIFEGMWHVFPMYSEGCGGGQELWPAMRALNHTARHIRTVARTGHPWVLGGLAPYHPNTHFVYDRSLGFRRGWFAPDRSITFGTLPAAFSQVPEGGSVSSLSRTAWGLCLLSGMVGCALGAALVLAWVARASCRRRVETAAPLLGV